ncbi:MAG: elongation factor Ts [Alphaproteobacteria bacterium CG_4_10_14_0_8_um_filter_37_21]|nr:MAG: elongation factor Ts [Alphaproteobacteria bacterium CG_4_10_14_0_8_um_filter_37_21]
MSQITSLMVKSLREQTGAGMMDCKKALTEVAGDIEAAVDWLRKKGLSAAAKKSGRIASEGLIAIASSEKSAAIIEINAETDFLARGEQFQNLATAFAKASLKHKAENAEVLKECAFDSEAGTVGAEVIRQVGIIGENLNLRRAEYFSVNSGVVSTYMHTAVAPNLGKIGVVIALESTADAEKLQELGKKIAMHVAAAAPQALCIEQVNPELVEREKNVLEEQARASGRPDNVIEKMIEGRIRKYFEEIVLLEQNYVIDGKTKIKDVIAEVATKLGTDIELTSYARFVLGDGIEKEETDFAAEVQAQAGL